MSINRVVIQFDPHSGASLVQFMDAVKEFSEANGMVRFETAWPIYVGEGPSRILAGTIRGSRATVKAPATTSPGVRKWKHTMEDTIRALWTDPGAIIVKQYQSAVPETVPRELATETMAAGYWIYVFRLELAIPSIRDPFLVPGTPVVRLTGHRHRPGKGALESIPAGLDDLKRLDSKLSAWLPYVGMTALDEHVAAFFDVLPDLTKGDADGS